MSTPCQNTTDTEAIQRIKGWFPVVSVSYTYEFYISFYFNPISQRNKKSWWIILLFQIIVCLIFFTPINYSIAVRMEKVRSSSTRPSLHTCQRCSLVQKFTSMTKHSSRNKPNSSLKTFSDEFMTILKLW
jgi:hypothetical protein